MAGKIIYRGYGPSDNQAGPRLVVIENEDGVIGPLPHAVLHSPDGFSWGYCGSAPADLARSLLIDAIGDEARCSRCIGRGVITLPCTSEDEIEPIHCPDCDRGYRISPDLYQQFKADVVAQLPHSGWTRTRTEILQWLAAWTPTELEGARGWWIGE